MDVLASINLSALAKKKEKTPLPELEPRTSQSKGATPF